MRQKFDMYPDSELEAEDSDGLILVSIRAWDWVKRRQAKHVSRLVYLQLAVWKWMHLSRVFVPPKVRFEQFVERSFSHKHDAWAVGLGPGRTGSMRKTA